MRVYLTRHWLALSTFALVNALDVLTTHVALASGLSEGNPIPALLLRSGGELSMYAVKLIVWLGLVIMAFYFTRWRLRWRAVQGVTVVLALVVISNTLQIV